jgi:hypothetical protein
MFLKTIFLLKKPFNGSTSVCVSIHLYGLLYSYIFKSPILLNKGRDLKIYPNYIIIFCRLKYCLTNFKFIGVYYLLYEYRVV